MELPPLVGLPLVLLLVVANGFFVATEFAVVAVRRSRLEQLEDEGHPGAGAAKDLVSHLDAYIAACQLGITMASLALGWLGEPVLAHLIEPPMERLVGTFAPTAAHGVAIGASFAVITALHIVIGELAPKGLALQRSEGTVLWVARPMQVFYLIFRWPITLLNATGNGVLRLAGLQPATGHEMVHSVEELRLLVNSSQEAGVVEESEARIARRAFRFADLDAGSLMTPRTELHAVPDTITLDALIAQVAAGTPSRLIVYHETIDDVVGVLHVRDLFKALRADAFRLSDYLRPAYSVPESVKADDLLEDLQARHEQLALIIDEYGGTAGVVTIEDLVEALVGPIDSDNEAPAAQPEPDGSVVMDGLTRLAQFEELAGVRLDREALPDVDTLGGLIMATEGRIPDVGDEITVAGRTLRVEARDGLRVAAVRLLPVQ